MSESKLIYSTVLLALAVLAVSAIGQDVLAQPEQPFFTVQADLTWQDSGMSVVAGQSYTLTASGQWTGGLFGFFGPVGTTWDPGYNMWVSGPHWGALVASIGQIASRVPPLSTVDETLPDPVPALHPFLTGNSVTFEAGNSGNLWFTINDDASGGNYSDNAGTLGVQLTMVPEPATWAMLVVGISLLIGTLRVAVAHHGPPLARCGNRSTTSFSRTASR